MSKNSFKNISMDYDTYQDELNSEHYRGYKSGLEMSLKVIKKIAVGWDAEDVIHEFFDCDASEEEQQVAHVLYSEFKRKLDRESS